MALLVSILLTALVGYSENNPSPILHLAPDEVAIFGYGSLTSKQSMEKSLNRPYNGPALEANLKGWERNWNVAMPNNQFYYAQNGENVIPEKVAYLNVAPNAEKEVTGMVFVVKKSDLPSFDRREWIYDRVSVGNNLNGIEVDGPVFMYTGKPEYTVSNGAKNTVVRQSYLKIIDDALKQAPERYQEQFRVTTPPPTQLVVEDKLDPSKPSPFGYKTQTTRAIRFDPTCVEKVLKQVGN